MNFPSDLLLVSPFVIALFKSTTSRAYFAERAKSVPSIFFCDSPHRKHTHTRALLFLIVITRRPFLCCCCCCVKFVVVRFLKSFSLLCPFVSLVFWSDKLVTPFPYFLIFFKFLPKKQLFLREKRHTKTPLWDSFIRILHSLFCSAFRRPLLAVNLRLNAYIYTHTHIR